ncbi:MAG TPA: SDR family NAD(P)-dependent oxidoreductase [Methylomusa anaerophila]|uniref:Polyketide synthase PksN n=1 Tax=Methylomusa anaerophila TaxID=1930071 RepID=A0A348AQU3_9FIRM|nr:SDR family NAD(P)-dependent oxidoreductase [Methylomusa anaerophila]BBB93441.1 polyketide synthase PksN [Methylomusa anaerophila]HML90310.1 SDR family NAD(P)-dependent oxidoreductase [Methylomusa anaerophila]
MKRQIDHKGALLLAQLFKLHEQLPEKRLFTFQQEKELSDFLTVKALVNKTKILGSMLQQKLAPQEKTLLLFPQGLDYIYSLLACWYANVVAVPIPLTDVSDQEQVLAKICAILVDSQAACVITDTKLKEFLTTQQVVTQIPLLNIDELPSDDADSRAARPQATSDIGMILYTSGSTSQPKGVMLSHGNLLSQALIGATRWEINRDSRIVTWMPQFHSFGLCFNLLSPLLTGAASVIMPPKCFIKDPEEWLKTIDKYQATHTGAPNFAFDYCCSLIDTTALKECSFRSLQAIICGGEPLRKETVESFTAKFQGLGLKKNIFCAEYGSSETGSIAASKPNQPLKFLSLDPAALSEKKIKLTNQTNKSKSVVSCGEISETVQILIVQPETRMPCVPGEIGEIWVKSPSVGRGYVNRPEETASTFAAVLSNTGEGEFLRTGDLGFIEDNQLYIVGREKEVIIIHGKNHYPVDIEWTIKKNIPELSLPLAVFACEVNEQEKVVVVQEVEASAQEKENEFENEKETPYKKLIGKIIAAVSETHAIEVYEIAFVNKGIVPKTGSGKVQRKLCHNLYIKQELPVLYKYQQGAGGAQPKTRDLPKVQVPSPQLNREIMETLKKHVFLPVLNADPARLEEVATFSELGLDSIQYVQISRGIENVFVIEFAPVALFKYRSFAELAEYISTQVAGRPMQGINPEKSQTETGLNFTKDNDYAKDNDKDNDNDGQESIAIIGIHYNLPGGADGLESFWENLVRQKDCITAIGASRPQIIADCQNTDGGSQDFFPPWGGFIEEVEAFDAPFFGISPLEAESMDPQQRKVLELVWGVIENSGYNPYQLAGKDIGLYIGAHNCDYAELVSRQPGLVETYGAYLDSGLHMSMIAHRISRWFNFRGPSEVVNTACSSSLVAIHHAVESIYRGESSMAIAGGINLILASRVYRACSKAGMLSPNGRCKTFDEQADGFVRGEGYGAVVLKPYRQAIADRDTIYGIIKGAVINHDGQSNSLRAPNLNAQKELIKAAYQKAGLPVETVGYIEAHGTGTPLGDPIEIQALQEAFQELNPDLPHAFCGLGTAKTNIGHCESASGIAGLIKVLFSMKYGTLPAILHFKKLNPYISLQNSPFFVVEQTREWKRLKDAAGHDIPRRAGISSFGLGGANAHVVIEEYIPDSARRQMPFRPENTDTAIIPIAAKTQAGLRTYAQQLHSFLSKSMTEEPSRDFLDQEETVQKDADARRLRGLRRAAYGVCTQASNRSTNDADALFEQSQEINLWDLAYTLQVGRAALEERLVFLVRGISELKQKLAAFIQNKGDISDCWHGHIKQGKNLVALLGNDEDFQQLVSSWIAKSKLNKVAQYWVQGGAVDWNLFYTQATPRRINLPSYPFARIRYWLPAIDAARSNSPAGTGFIHPLLQQNTSDLSGQQFSSIFTGREFFLADHMIHGQPVLPAAACLEMARAAVAQVAARYLRDKTGICLKNIIWANPIKAAVQPVRVHIGLCLDDADNGEIAYEIYSEGPGNGEQIVHSQGSAALRVVADIPALDIKAVQAECSRSTLTAAQCYQAYKKIGIDYGPGHQGIETVYAGAGQVLAKLGLPACVSATQNQFILHPSIVDAAVQAAISFMLFAGDAGSTAGRPVFPLELQELEIFGSCAAAMWAVLRGSDDSAAGGQVRKLNIDLCDAQGNVCIRMKGFSLRVLAGEADAVETPAAYGALMLQSDWKEQDIPPADPAPEYEQHLAILCEPAAAAGESIGPDMNRVRCLVLTSEQDSLAERFRNYAARTLAEIQTIFQGKPKGKLLVQIVVSTQAEQHLFAGLAGLLKTAQIENPKLSGQLIEVEAGENSARITEILQENSRNPWDHHIRYQGGKRYVAGWRGTEVSPAAANPPWKDRGVYLITGGAGGLGRIFAGEIARKVKDATLILTGRSALTADKQAELEQLAALGARIEYKQVDVTQQQAVHSLIRHIEDSYGSLQGIIHSAGIIKDNFILKKTQAELEEVLAPKVAGLVHLDEASKHLPLDFFVSFSSIAGSIGNVGQADYAAANAFMDAYARYRSQLAAANQRHGQTLSINWPLWQEGGMRIDEESQKTIRKNTGMIAMQTATGISAFYQALAAGKEQVMVVEGDVPRMQDYLLTVSPQADADTEEAAAVQAEPWLLREKTLHQLKVLFSEISKMNVAGIDPEEPLESYGIDSIMITRLNQKLDGIFGELSKTLFYEYQTLSALAEYFTADYPQKCLQWTGLNNQVRPMPAKPILSPAADELPAPAGLKTRRQLSRGFTAPTADRSAYEPVAIIGMSGRYPQAKKLTDYWENLKAGRDCITEIPPERWSLDGFYHPDPQEAAVQGKSYSKWGGFVEGFAEFDPLFFSISPREVINMDPQERLFLESCWEVLEDAGYTREQLGAQYNRRVGVFAGITKTGFDLYGPDLWKEGEQVYPRTSFGSVANRISYLLNLQGPSMPIDTMCSASLTAIHEACEHLYRGECEMAIAGGVNLYLHPANYVDLCNHHMLSEDGKCKSFGLGGNGFVPGEGVGAVLLKSLSRAVADGDHIYAVIRGTSINHGGKTNGYTVPNPVAQGDLIRAALDKAGVNARAVSYIEAHGTGTALGDPIEIAGLSQAFQKDTQDTGFCAIGSVKSNIGHLEAAAGIAGVTKIVLQMQNQAIAPSLHAQELNPNINFVKTPFAVQQELAPWKRPVATVNGRTQEYPRIAGISSFGAGGSNAHVVLEEYIPPSQERHITAITPQNPAIIVLSAKDEAGLKLQVQQLLAVLPHFAAGELRDVAYTLQVGREAMEERLAVTAGSIQELAEKLQNFAAGRDGIKDLYRGQAKQNKETLAVFTADEDMAKIIDVWIAKGKYAKLLDLWVKGLVFDWNKLYGDTKPRRVSLPTYPFARERYWLPATQAKPGGRPAAIPALSGAIHPLLQQNTSDFAEQRFTSTFTGQEFFLADHVIKGQPVLPGVAYLEMARAAVAQATGVRPDEKSRFRLRNIIWARPIAAGGKAVEVHIGLHPEEDRIAYEIYSRSGEAGDGPIVHSQGSAVLSPVAEAPAADLPALQAQCSQRIFSPDQCYEAFQAMGIDYGPAHRGIERVYVGSGQVLAKLSLPLAVAATRDQFVLHPSLMDSALQASIGLMMSAGDTTPSGGMAALKPVLPFALQEIEIFSNCPAAMWALIRYGDGGQDGDKVQKLDIDLYDAEGNICVRMKGLSSRVLEGEASSAKAAAPRGTLILRPDWREQASAREAAALDYVQQVAMLCEPDEISREIMATPLNGVRCLLLESKHESMEERFQDYAAQAFEEIQNILKAKPAGQVLVQIVLRNQEEQQLFTGLAGLLKTARLENPKLTGQLIEIEPAEDAAGIINKLRENSLNPMDDHVRYQAGQRLVAVLSEIETPPEAIKVPWKDRGVYLITGGAGGLGLIFAEEIARQVRDATLILTGRSSLDAGKQGRIKELESLGARIAYKQVDVTREQAVAGLIQSIRDDFGGINGIIHSAGVIKDNFIIKKTKDELLAVLAPKVTGLVRLDQASQHLPLDFFIFFSSGAGVLGNPGQADYAAANAFMDAYARYRSSLAAAQQRHGRTLSINWPLWQEGGMHVDAQTEKMMEQSTGMMAMQTATGIKALYQSIAFDQEQVMVMEGNVTQLRRSLVFGSAPREITTRQEKAGLPGDSLKVQTLNFVKQTLANEIKLSPDRIQIDTPFEKYGVDSIVQMNLIREMEKVTGELSKTLLFEHTNIQELVEYLVKNHAGRLKELTAPESDGDLKQGTTALPALPATAPSSLPKKNRFTGLPRPEQTLTKQAAADIAIIGISGRYPLSNTLAELWEHLIAGHNCITEAPPDRWRVSLTKALAPDRLQHLYKRHYGGFLDPINRFDHHLFDIAQEQVLEFSPELRLFLEIVWETFEDAGYTRAWLQELQTGYHSGIGVFVGTMYSQYSWTIPSLEQAVLSSNVTDWQIANRTSHFFNLTGPSIAVNSACSGSLTAIHLACESLKQQSCSMAIAGGINLTLDPAKFFGLQQIKFLGSGNQNKSFGTGDGYIPGEGVGAVLLKPLPLAIKDGDHVHGVIKSSFVNHSGGRQVYTAPDPKQQAQLIAESIRRAGIDPETIGYVESAANGSDLGDPIEVIALNNAFKQYTDRQQFCALGSVKSNLGHLEAASGISQLSKVILQLKHKTLAPTIHASPQNPNIKLDHTAFYLQKETRPWQQLSDPRTGGKLPRRSLINSFGAGGAYANLIVEEFMAETPATGASISSPQEYLIIFSARTEWSLMKYTEKLQEFLRKNSAVAIADIAQKLQKVNHNLEHRVAIIASSGRDLSEKLSILQKSGASLTDAGIYLSASMNFAADDAEALVIQQALAKQELRQLAQYWAAGAVIDFRRLNENTGTPGIDLPKYAFEHNIKFDFNKEAVNFDAEFFQILLDRIAKGELSEDEFKDAMM